MQRTDGATSVDTATRTAAEAEALVVETIQQHAESLLRAARRFSLCQDDAQDAYQRALEIFLRHARTLEADHAYKWLHRVVRNEAHAVREQRQRILGHDAVDFDHLEAVNSPSPEDSVLAFDTVARSAEALQRLKPQEVRALWLKASGRSYAEIASECGWSYTKVNRCITEGRRSFLSRYSAIEAGEECARWAPVISALVDGEATAVQLTELRPHLRNCAACRADLRALHGGDSALSAVFPVGLVVGATATSGHFAWITRAHAFVASQVHERLMGSLLRVQAAADAFSAGKVAAVAASAAALAGGGIVVVQSSGRPEHRAVVRGVPSHRVVALPVRAESAPRVVAGPVHHGGASRRDAGDPPARKHRPKTKVSREFTIESPEALPRRTAPATRAPARSVPTTSSAVKEFAP